MRSWRLLAQRTRAFYIRRFEPPSDKCLDLIGRIEPSISNEQRANLASDSELP